MIRAMSLPEGGEGFTDASAPRALSVSKPISCGSLRAFWVSSSGSNCTIIFSVGHLSSTDTTLSSFDFSTNMTFMSEWFTSYWTIL